MRRMTLLTAGLLMGLAVLLAACEPGQPEVAAIDQVAAEDRAALEAAEEGEGGEGGEGGENTPVPPEGETVVYAGNNNLEWTQAPEEMPAGPATVELQCEGLPHNVVYEGVNNEEPVVECDGAGTVTGQQDLQPGEYVYYCSVPGHRAAGMEGTAAVVG